jgi:outer membrane protein OmpA-like peptidoglycan-associated protein
MHPLNRLNMPWITLLLVLFLSACGGRPPSLSTVVENQDPVEQLVSLESDLEAARQENLNILSPRYFAKAERLYQEAQDMLERETDLSEILLTITAGRVELQRSEQTAQIARTVLADVIKVRELALAAGAADLGTEYTATEDRFLQLTRAIEDNDLDSAQKDKAKVFNAFDQLELRAIKERNLGEAHRLLDQAIANRAARQAPLSLAEAQQKLDEADAFVTTRRYQRDEIRQKAAEALFYSRRLEQIMLQSQRQETLPAEQAALYVEGLLHQTAEQLNLPDQRDRVFEGQLEGILTAIASSQQQGQDQQDEIGALEATIDQLRVQIASLEGSTRDERTARQQLAEERRFQKLFSQVQGVFSPGEAEVYKQGDRLIIRLKTMSFSVGQAVIESDNYPLLAKAQQAIALFGEPQAVIEGHTDSTGSAAANLVLSQKRAEAVRAYLVANDTLPKEKVEATGYGSERPLASDQTAAGRAINRRIDIVLIPAQP